MSLKERRRRQFEQEQRRKRLLYAGVVVIIVVLLGALIYSRLDEPIPGVIDLGAQIREHAEDADVAGEPGLPPAGGTHNPRWLNCGIYREPVENDLAVHSLEHGAVWITYHPDLSATDVALLEDYADNFTLVSPYPDLQTDVVVTAWGKRLLLDELPDERLDDFIDRYQGEGPEPGTTCSGGVGTPLG